MVPIILTSDETHLTNFSGDKKAWPIYLTIENLPLTIRSKLSQLATVLLALLPVPPKIGDVPTMVAKQYAQIKLEALHQAIRNILQPLKDISSEGLQMECADLQQRQCYPILAAWLTDHMEYIDIFCIKKDCCPVCEVSSKQLGMSLAELQADNLRPLRRRDYQRYIRLQQTILDDSTSAQRREVSIHNLEDRGIRGPKWILNVLSELPYVHPNLLHTPDLLHGVYLGLLDHLMTWIEGLLKKYK